MVETRPRQSRFAWPCSTNTRPSWTDRVVRVALTERRGLPDSGAPGPPVFVLLVLAVLLQPLSLDSITIERVRALDGGLVAATFLVAKPNYTLMGFTMIGAADRDDDAERAAVLRGNRL